MEGSRRGRDSPTGAGARGLGVRGWEGGHLRSAHLKLRGVLPPIPVSPFTAGQEPGGSRAAHGQLWPLSQLLALPSFPDLGSVFAGLSVPVGLPSLVWFSLPLPSVSLTVPFSVSLFITLSFSVPTSASDSTCMCHCLSLFLCLSSGHQPSIPVCLGCLWL